MDTLLFKPPASGIAVAETVYAAIADKRNTVKIINDSLNN